MTKTRQDVKHLKYFPNVAASTRQRDAILICCISMYVLKNRFPATHNYQGPPPTKLLHPYSIVVGQYKEVNQLVRGKAATLHMTAIQELHQQLECLYTASMDNYAPVEQISFLGNTKSILNFFKSLTFTVMLYFFYLLKSIPHISL